MATTQTDGSNVSSEPAPGKVGASDLAPSPPRPTPAPPGPCPQSVALDTVFSRFARELELNPDNVPSDSDDSDDDDDDVQPATAEDIAAAEADLTAREQRLGITDRKAFLAYSFPGARELARVGQERIEALRRDTTIPPEKRYKYVCGLEGDMAVVCGCVRCLLVGVRAADARRSRGSAFGKVPVAEVPERLLERFRKVNG